MSISRAQASAIADGYLDSLGTAPPAEGLPIIEAVLSEAAKAFIDDAVANLDRKKAVDTGELATQLTFAVTVMGRDYLLTVGYPSGTDAAKYYDYVNKGVQGTMKGNSSPYRYRNNKVSKAFVDALMAWYRRQGKGAVNIRKSVSALERKRVGLRNTAKKTDGLRNLAYATAVAIKKKGKAPTNYFDNAVSANFGNELVEVLSVALAGDVRLQIRQINNEQN